MASENVQLSVVVPLLNEQDSIKALYEEIKKSLSERYGDNYEIVFVDDGSTDDSFTILAGLQKLDGRVRVISFVGISARPRRLAQALSIQEER